MPQVHRVLVDIVSAAAKATPGLGRYPPFKREVDSINFWCECVEIFSDCCLDLLCALSRL